MGVYRPAHRWTSRAASTCRRPPPRPELDLARRASPEPPGDPREVAITATCDALAARARAAGRPRAGAVVFTNGCFDLLHPGHVRAAGGGARAEGDVLVVGLNTDASVRAPQGRGPRPSCPRASARRRCCALEAVDRVVVYDEDTPREIIAALLPDVLVKGADWAARRDRGPRRGGGGGRPRGARGARAGPLHHRHRRADPPAVSAAPRPRAWLAALAADPRLDALRRALDAARWPRSHGLTGPARLLAAAAAHRRARCSWWCPRERDVERAGRRPAHAGRGGRAPRARCCPSRRPGPRPSAGCPATPDAALRRAAALHAARARPRCARWWPRPPACCARSLAPRLFETRVVALAAGDEMTPGDPARGARRGRLPPRGPGHRARPGGAPRRHPRRLPARPRRARCASSSSATPWRACAASTPRPSARRRALDALEILPLSDVVRAALRARRAARALPERFAGHRDLPGPAGEARARPAAATSSPSCCRWSPAPPCPPGRHLRRLDGGGPRAGGGRARRPRPSTRARARSARAAPTRCALEPAEALVPAGRARRRGWRRARRSTCARWTSSGAASHLASRARAPLRGRPARAVRRPRRGRRAARSCSSARPAAPSACATCCARTASPSARARPSTCASARSAPASSCPTPALAVLADGDVFPEEVHLHPAAAPRRARSFLSDFRDLKVGDLVVHQDHGIGRFEGLETLEVGGAAPRVHGPRLPGRRQAQGAGRGLRPRAEVRERGGRAARRRQAGQRAAGTRSSARQEGHARHGRGAAEALRRAQGAARATPSPARAPGSASSRRPSNTRRRRDQAAAIADVAADMAARRRPWTA